MHEDYQTNRNEQQQVDLDKVDRLCDAANAESGPWSIGVKMEVDGSPDMPGGIEGVFVCPLSDGPSPGKAAARFIRDSRERESRLVAELRAAREVIEASGPVILNPHLPERIRRLHEARDAYNRTWGGAA